MPRLVAGGELSCRLLRQRRIGTAHKAGECVVPARSRTSWATRRGSVASWPDPVRTRSAKAQIVGWYGGLGGGTVIDEPAQSVRTPPGSSTVTCTPHGAILGEPEGEPGDAHFAAW